MPSVTTDCVPPMVSDFRAARLPPTWYRVKSRYVFRSERCRYFGFTYTIDDSANVELTSWSTLTPSRVLEAMGVLTHGNVRVSLTRDTTEEDVDGFLAALPEVVRDIRAEAGL